MRYAKIRKMDISNGKGIRVSLFVQGCDFHCKECFNQETWDFESGKEWNETVKNTIIKLINKDYISGLTVLGGEPLHPNNIKGVAELIHDIKSQYPTKTVWVYTGFTYEYLLKHTPLALIDIDVLVDGLFVSSLKDYKLKFRGSSNQRIIDVKKSLHFNEVVLWDGDKDYEF